MAKDIFKRLSAGQPPIEKATKRQRKNADLVAQWEKDLEIKTFLTALLAKGPVSATAVEKRGLEQGFTKMRLWRIKRLIGIISFKKGIGFDSRWFWALPKNAPSTEQPRHRYTRRLRDLSKSLGYRLQPIGKRTSE